MSPESLSEPTNALVDAGRRGSAESAGAGSGVGGGNGTSVSRADLVALADRMLAAVRPFASPGHARITLPGPEGGYGSAVDGLEGFARTFLLAGFRIAGEPDAPRSAELAEWYAQGMATGTDPGSPERWVRLTEHPQAKVEAASIALILDLTRPWLWDRLDATVQERVVEYLAPAVGDATYPRINWVWFRLVVQTFLRSVGGPYSLDEMAEDLATHDTFARVDGWLADGHERAYDHYVGWALHLYPTLWARMAGAEDLAAPRRERDRAMLDRFLTDAVALVGADGSPLIQGRSLIYRFAAAAPFWAGALAGVPSVPPGQLRAAATRIIAHFVRHGAPDERGLLTLGWHGPWPRLAQTYSGPSSPYWAAKGLLGIALGPDHPVWTAAEEPLPVDIADTLVAIRAPGWLVSGTRADGIVRVVNHGTDHAVEGSTLSDSPLYARLGYSTATSPVLDETGWSSPVDQTVALVDAAGRPTHRTGLRPLATTVVSTQDGFRVGVAASVASAHWVDARPGPRDHGSGRSGDWTPVGRLVVVSLVRRAWEVRLVRVEELVAGVDGDALRLRVGGWPVAGAGEERRWSVGATVSATPGPGAGPLSSSVVALGSAAATAVVGVTTRPDGGPLGGPVRVPWLEFPVSVGDWIPVLVELDGGRSVSPPTAALAVDVTATPDLAVAVTWPDGVRTDLNITLYGSSVPVVRQRSGQAALHR